MELLVLDDNFDEIGRVDQFYSLQWTPQYYDVGSFELHCSTDLFSIFDVGKYLYRPNYGDKYNLAFIQDIVYTRKSNGAMDLSISGNFIEDLLNDRIIPEEKNYSGTADQIAKQLVTDYFISTNPYPNLSVDTASTIASTSTISVKYQGKKIGDTIFSLLKEAQMSCCIVYDYLTNTLMFKVWQGLDRTDDQQVNEWAVFSDDFETIKDLSYERDTSKYRNYAIVVGIDDIRQDVDQRSNGELIKELWVKSSLSKKKDDGSTMTDAEYKERLLQIGKEKLSENNLVETFDGDVDINSSLQYKIDFDIGDLCTCKVHEIGKMAEKRITKIREVYEDGETSITPQFGDDYVALKFLIGGTSE